MINKHVINKLLPPIFCILISLIFCYPFLNGNIFLGPDTTFHMNRIEGLSIALQNQDYFPRILYHQNFNFGYGSPLFYSIFFLYFPALLRNLNISVYDTYHIFLFTCAILSALSMFYCSKTILKNKKMGYSLLTVMFYIWNVYYMSIFYKRGAVG